ncbi:cytochrome P450 [Microdochium trichocladiopsis]|uniref:Cytochrome P450 n=1 Tax=Microdochium trichocladiopsis TaxID=1682393 RepID=A0A9P8YDS2_9PEZI|nr:cytochrome P450 [Microdochium trichocladiopsis]KAH7036035.1 cytochrome P450 [Microdochium trichocladiopsis]
MRTTQTIVYQFGRAIYRLYFHPLSKYPGPRLAAISEIFYARMVMDGRWPWIMNELHVKYGPIVRIAPNEISFSSVQSAKDIYGPSSKTRKLFKKNIAFYDTGDIPPATGLIIDTEAHADRRAILQPGFRIHSLRNQEFLIHEHTDTMLNNFDKWMAQSSDGSINMEQVYTWLTFDIVAHLVFGESFGATKHGQAHFWVSILLGGLHAGIIMALRHRLPIIDLLIKVLPWVSSDVRAMIRNMEAHQALTLEKVRKRVSMGSVGFNDIMQSALDDGTMTEAQLASEMTTMLVAGAETSATALTAATWFLATNKPALQALQHEIRSKFTSYDAITGDATAALPYLNSVIEETLRLFPPVPIGPPRVSPGEFVDGTYVPSGVGVSTHCWYVHQHPDHMARPQAFQPERWIDDEKSKTGQSKQKPFTMPFNIGPRACLGINLAYRELRVALAKLVYRYDFDLAEEQMFGDGKDWTLGCRMTSLWKKPPLRVKFTTASTA